MLEKYKGKVDIDKLAKKIATKIIDHMQLVKIEDGSIVSFPKADRETMQGILTEMYARRMFNKKFLIVNVEFKHIPKEAIREYLNTGKLKAKKKSRHEVNL